MPIDKGYEAGEEESKKIEEIIARRGEPIESTEEDQADYAEDVELAKKVEEPRFKAEEPILLYIRTGIGTYTVVNRQFDSRVAARRFAEENYPGEKYKVYTESEAIAEGEKQQKKLEKIQRAKTKVKEGAKRIVKGAGEASYAVARSQRMTRPQMEPRIRRSWGVEQRAPEHQPPGINIQIGTQQPPVRQPEPEQEEYEEPIESYREERRPYRPPQPFKMRPTSRMSPPQRRTRINIPPGGGVFKGRRFVSDSPESPYQRRPIRTTPAFRRTGIRATPPYRGGINVGGMHKASLHMITPRGISTRRRQPVKEKKKKSKRRK